MAAVNTEFPLITLTTDFGIQDNYAGIVKGIIAGQNPRAQIIDISHEVPVYNIRAGRYLLETAYDSFPPGTIHVGIVDPGVGTSRRALLIETEKYFLVGPDSGLFSFLAPNEIKRAWSLTEKKYFLKQVSSTFHGRDVFAPVAAYLSLGVAPDEMGTRIRAIERPAIDRPKKVGKIMVGTLIYIDRFGNLVTSFRENDFPARKVKVYLNEREMGPIEKTYGVVEEGYPVCYINSCGYLEIAIREDSAADIYEIDYDSNPKIVVAPL